MKKRIALLGAPASGKGTQAEMIQPRYQIPISSSGAMRREEKRRGATLALEAAEFARQDWLLPEAMLAKRVDGSRAPKVVFQSIAALLEVS